jgi:hypothetical protein
MRADKLTLLLLALVTTANATPTPEDPETTDTPLPASATRQARDEAWWTGPLLAASPVTLPPGHFLIEPYVFDSIPQGHYDSQGTRHSGPHANDFGSQSYVLYGLLDRLTVGLIPRFGFNDPGNGPSSSRPGIGDLTMQATYELTRYEEGSWLPASAFVLQETLPAGKYDRLGDRPADGLGGGVYSTSLSLYSQYYFWMPSGRILRTRLDYSYTLSGSAAVKDVSVYGTGQGFVGRARPGNSTLVDAALEYSVTRNWVLALDVAYEHDSSTHVAGTQPPLPGDLLPTALIELNSGAGRSWSLAPALEYNFNSRVGVIAGVKLTVAGRNSTAVVVPVVAVNIVI